MRFLIVCILILNIVGCATKNSLVRIPSSVEVVKVYGHQCSSFSKTASFNFLLEIKEKSEVFFNLENKNKRFKIVNIERVSIPSIPPVSTVLKQPTYFSARVEHLGTLSGNISYQVTSCDNNEKTYLTLIEKPKWDKIEVNSGGFESKTLDEKINEMKSGLVTEKGNSQWLCEYQGIMADQVALLRSQEGITNLDSVTNLSVMINNAIKNFETLSSEKKEESKQTLKSFAGDCIIDLINKMGL